MTNNNTITNTTADTLEAKIEALKDLEEFAAEIKAEIDTLKDELKAVLVEREVEELVVGKNIIRYTTVLSQRFNSTELKKKLPEIYTAYLKQVTSKRFSVA